MLEALKVSQDDLNRLHEKARFAGSFDVALIEAFIAASPSNRANLAYVFPWLVSDFNPCYVGEELVERQWAIPGLCEVSYVVRLSEADEVREFLNDLENVICSLDEFLKVRPRTIHIIRINMV